VPYDLRRLVTERIDIKKKGRAVRPARPHL
jgi:hypothetical protein